MKLGITGKAKSGKTTLFNAVTGQNADINLYDVKQEPNLGVVLVPDERIDKLSNIYKPQKTIFATIEFLDFPAMTEDTENHEFLSATSMALLKNTDALAIILRNFTNTILDETKGKSNPINDLNDILIEFIYSDILITEKRLEKIELNFKRGVKDATTILEEKTLKKCLEFLHKEIPIREANLADDELRIIKGFHFLSLKPVMIILNSDENNFGQNQEIITNLSKIAPVYEFAGKFELELSILSDEEAKDFMEDIGISESAVIRIIKNAYDLLGYISFFTVGEDEVRAWTIQKGDNALTAAGKIHTDLARGFIRAETFKYEDLISLGSEKVIREKGLFRLEGKTYIVQDGDIIFVRFNV
ncbi:MAG: YchF family ATPase [Candidatus Cloacimonetes bacterium]|nr:YchF family ATPase [Candidatus Cloacimonadota bacterium]